MSKLHIIWKTVGLTLVSLNYAHLGALYLFCFIINASDDNQQKFLHSPN